MDDEEIVLETASSILKELGYKVTKCSSGAEALEIFQDPSQKIDLVILDLVMPGMNGHKVFEAMKVVNPNIPVLLSSGYSIDSHAREILEKGALEFIQKPFRMAHLSKVVAKILGQAQLPPTSPKAAGK